MAKPPKNASPKAPLLALKDVRLMDGMTPLFDGVDIALERGVRVLPQTLV